VWTAILCCAGPIRLARDVGADEVHCAACRLQRVARRNFVLLSSLKNGDYVRVFQCNAWRMGRVIRNEIDELIAVRLVHRKFSYVFIPQQSLRLRRAH